MPPLPALRIPASATSLARATWWVAALLLIAAGSAQTVDVECWRPYDASFTAAEPENPFTQDFKATVRRSPPSWIRYWWRTASTTR